MRSPYVRIAGKTGTAQLLGEDGQYERNSRHRVSFCGYFPAEKPEYTCICVIHNPRHGAHSGGVMGGKVVRDIAERIVVARATRQDSETGNDSIAPYPRVKAGYARPALQLCKTLGIAVGGAPTQPEGLAHLTAGNDGLNYQKEPLNKRDRVPDVRGMGARDAIYLMERSGLRVKLNGMGRVVEQSISAGQKAPENGFVVLTLR